MSFDYKHTPIYKSCLKGNMEKVEKILEGRINEFILADGLQGACKGGHKEIIQLMIEEGIYSWNYGLLGACEGGHKEIIQLMIEKGARDWNRGLQGACSGGNKEII